MTWDEGNIGDLRGKTFVVTGANSGLGLESSRALAEHGATVVMCVRDLKRSADAIRLVEAAAPRQSNIDAVRLDLADLASVAEAADQLIKIQPRIDVLINNAGVMAIPRRETADGFEMQFGTNHLGHFALTGRLLPALLKSGAEPARVITVSSNAHKIGRMNFDDLMAEHRYSKWRVYGQSKLANLLFAYELQRRAEAANAPLLSLAAHPGFAATNLANVGPSMGGRLERAVMAPTTAVMSKLLGQNARMGALPQLYAATEPDLPGGTYVGPDGFGEQRGHPKVVGSTSAARDTETASRLWDASVELTGVDFAQLEA